MDTTPNTPDPQTPPLSGPDIDRVVTAFYARIRVHPVLGPIFNGRVGDDAAHWGTHEDKISRFWRNVFLQERQYHGFPMRTHLQTPEIKAAHFDIWLGLFEQVLQDELPPPLADEWAAVAHRIGRGMRLGVADRDAPKGAVPSLF